MGNENVQRSPDVLSTVETALFEQLKGEFYEELQKEGCLTGNGQVRVNFRLFVLVFSLSLGLFSQLRSQSQNLPLDHWAYRFLDRLETKGLYVSEDFDTQPYSRHGEAASRESKIGKIGKRKTLQVLRFIAISVFRYPCFGFWFSQNAVHEIGNEQAPVIADGITE